MKKKHLQALIGITAGIGVAAAHAVPLQMVFFSVGIFGILVLAFWGDRNSSGFWIRAAMACALHLIFLYACRGFFPIKSVLVFVFMALIECIVLMVIMIRRDAEEPAAR
jgi:hypothetical protein